MQSNEDVYESNTYRNGSVADAQQRLTDILLRRLHFHRRKLSECSDTVCKEGELFKVVSWCVVAVTLPI